MKGIFKEIGRSGRIETRVSGIMSMQCVIDALRLSSMDRPLKTLKNAVHFSYNVR
jgi:hypothetical protein